MSPSYKVFDIDPESYRFGRGQVLDDDCNALVVWANRKEAEGRGAAGDRCHVGDLLVVLQRADPRVPIPEVHPRVCGPPPRPNQNPHTPPPRSTRPPPHPPPRPPPTPRPPLPPPSHP